MKKGLLVRLDTGRSMTDAHSTIMMRWDYMAIVEDGGMNMMYKEHFSSHPFL